MSHFSLLALGLLAASAALAPAALAQGRLDFEGMEHDFGSFAEGEQATHVFTFTNTGDQPVTLAEVRASCGCTTPSYTTGPIAPGGTGAITVVYNSQGRPGDFEKAVAVRAAGAEPEAVTLHITGSVVPASLTGGVTQGGVVFDADLFELAAPAGGPVVHTFRMQNAGARPVRIRSARALAEGVEVTVPSRPVFPGEIVEVVVTVPRPQQVAAANGALDVAVVLETDDADQPQKSLRLRGRVAG